MKRRFTRACSCLGSLALAGLFLSAPAGQAADRALLLGHRPEPLVRLRPFARLSTTTNLSLAIGLPLRNQEALTRFLQDLYNPSSPVYHHYLTPEEFTRRFGPSEHDYRAVIDFTLTNGLTITGTHPNRLVLDVAGPVAAVETAFQVRLRVYQHPLEPRIFFAPDVEPSVPPGIAVLDVSGLDNYVLPHPLDLKYMPLGVQSYAQGSGPGGNFIGNDFRAAYAPGVSLTGLGQAVGLFQFGPYFSNNIPTYEQRAGLPTNIVVTNVLLDGVSGVPNAGADDGEESLDIEMAMSMAPGATIIVYEGTSAYDIFNRMATDNRAKQLSCSWGFSPPPSGMDNIFLEFAAQGQTLFVASGDGGAYSSSQAILAPADDPNITSVGGTSLTTANAGGAWQSETTWIGSGGGVSPTYPIPSWQRSLNLVPIHGSTTRRNIPDVAMLADTVIFFVSKNGQTGTIGGTSAASPLWAGFMALVNQQAAANGKPPIGFLNPLIYSLGQSATYSTSFHDITTGNTMNNASPTNFTAGPGYDLCTGWGTPNGRNLINALAGPTDSLQITPGTGFTATTPYGTPFGPVNVSLSLTNTGAAAVNWSLGNTSVWLKATATSGILNPGAPAASLNISLDSSTLSNLSSGYYYANVWFTNQTSGLTQDRLFTLVVSSANWPLGVSGFNAGVIAPSNATPGNPGATGFDILNNYCFYQAGLSGSTRGLPQAGEFTSQADGATVFQFGPYGSKNVLLMGKTYPNAGTLVLDLHQSYNSLAVLASSANGGGVGALVVHFADGTTSPVFNFNDQDWYNTSTNVALQGFGRLNLNSFAFEDPGPNNPNFYQTILNLAALGLNQPVAAITFTNPTAGANQDSGIFAVSGALMPPQVLITQQPASVTNNVPSQGAALNVAAMGAPPLNYQWYYSSMGSPGSFAPAGGLTNASLVLAPVLDPTNAGSFYVVVTNNFNAATSSLATLTIFRAPSITRQPAPADLALLTGQSFNLSVAATAAQPLNYSWTFDGAPIAGASNSSLALATMQFTSAGSYSVVLSNAFGMATSAVVTLRVVAPATSPYAQLVLADSPVAYWPLGETSGVVAHDFLGGKNGVYNRVLLGQPGNNLVDLHTVARFGILASANSCATNIPIDFASAGNATFSVEAWVNGPAQNNDAGLLTKGTGAGGEQFNLDCGSANHAFRFFVRDAGGGVHLANGTVAPNSHWHHVTGVCDEAKGKVLLYVDGISNASGAITPGSGLQSASIPMSIGARPSGPNTAYDLQFVGSMEEIAVYNYALSPAQVRAHYSSATNRPPAFLLNPFAGPMAGAGQPYAGNIATNAVDPNGDSISFSKLSGPAWLNVAADGTLTGTPLSPDAGTNMFDVRAIDPGGLFGDATLNVLVVPAPRISAQILLQTTNLLLSWSGGVPPYKVQMATNLATPDWQTVSGLLSVTNLALSPTNDSAYFRILGQ